MNILCITNNTDNTNGIGRYSSGVLQELSRRAVAYAVITNADLFPNNTIVGFIKNCFLVRRRAQEHDQVHTFMAWPYGVYGWFAVLGTKKKLFISAHGSYAVGPLSGPWKRRALTLAYMRAHTIYCISRYTQKRIRAIVPGAPTMVIHGGASPLPHPSGEEIARTQKRYGIGDYTPIILTVGAIKHRKGQLDTLKALALLKKDYPKLCYVVVGSDDDHVYREKMKTFAKEHSMEKSLKIIPDARDDETLAALYQSADVFAMNSNNDQGHFEGFGLVFLEANQFGVPTVGSQDCGIEDAIEDGYSGFLTAQGDHKDIAEKIQKVLVGDKKQWSHNAREFYARFSWKKIVEEYITQYQASS